MAQVQTNNVVAQLCGSPGMPAFTAGQIQDITVLPAPLLVHRLHKSLCFCIASVPIQLVVVRAVKPLLVPGLGG